VFPGDVTDVGQPKREEKCCENSLNQERKRGQVSSLPEIKGSAKEIVKGKPGRTGMWKEESEVARAMGNIFSKRGRCISSAPSRWVISNASSKGEGKFGPKGGKKGN